MAPDSAKIFGSSAQFLARGPQIGELNVRISGRDLRMLVHAFHEFSDAEQAERQRNDFDAIVKMGDAEGESGRAGFEIAADDAEQKADDRHGDALERRAARERRAREQAEQHQRADFGRPKVKRDRDQDRR